MERPDDCKKIQVASDTKVGPPPVDPDAIDQAATRVCIRRALVGHSNLDKAQAADQAKRFVAVLPDLAHERDAEGLGGLQGRFLNDLKEHLPVVRTEDYQPKLSRPAVIRMTPEEARAQHAFLNGDTSQAQAALAAALTSYETCVDDAGKQLETKLAGWRKRKAQAPQRQEALSDYLTKECRRYADVVKSARDVLAKARQRLDQLKARTTGGTEVPPLPSAEVRLDFESCRGQNLTTF